MDHTKNALPTIFFIIVLCVIYISLSYDESKNLEGFEDEMYGLTYLGLDDSNYPGLLNTYFVNNSPITDSGVLARQKDAKFCVNDSAMSYREQLGQFEKCKVANDIVNKIFTIDVKTITDHFTNKIVDDIKEFETKYINKVFKPNVNKAMEKYIGLQNDIMIREKMLTQNKEILDKFDKMNSKLVDEKETIQTQKTDEKHLIDEYTDNISVNKSYNKKLKKYIKYGSIVFAIMVLYLLFKMHVKTNGV